VVVPGLLTGEQDEVVRFILEAQRPAHTLFELCSLASGIRVGKALHVGISSLVGKSGGFDELELGGTALGRSAVLGFAAPGQRLGIDRLGVSTRRDGGRIE
jgi:hypothetical protein